MTMDSRPCVRGKANAGQISNQESKNTMQGQKRTVGFSIFHKLLLTMVVVALVPLAGLWYISSYKAKVDWTSNISEGFVQTTDALAIKVSDWEDMNLRVLKQSAAVEPILSMTADRQNPFLKSIATHYPWAYLVFTVRPDGQNVGRSDDKPTMQYGDRSYFKQVMNGNPLGREVVIGKTSGKPALILAGPITGASSELLGVIAMAMDLGDLSKTVTDARIGETGYAILLDDRNKVIAHGRPEKLTGVLQDLGSHPAMQLKGSDQGPMVFEEDGKRIVAYRRKLGQGWSLIVQQDYDEAFAPLRQVERNALILMVLTVVLVSAVAYWLGHRLADPIRRLTTLADNISRGEISGKILETERGDEIGALARAIERMSVSIQMAMGRLRKRA
jgi:methyl-accepting chemotaxis protein